MSGNLDGFNAEEVEPKTDFEVLPAGDYIGIAINSAFEDTKNKDGEFLKIEFEIVEGEYRGRRLFDRLNLKNKNETAVKIAQATLSSICRAIGVLRPKDSSELHNKTLRLKVEVEERKDKPGSFSNRIKNYESVTSASTGHASSVKPVAATSEAGTPPWKRKSA